MGNAAIIEVAIGLIFVFSLLSILVTQINTLIVNFLNLKAKRLKEQLELLLTDPVIRAKILTHPLIRMVETDQGGIILTEPEQRFSAQTAADLTKDKKARVEYIDSKQFVDVLIDVLTSNTGKKLYEELEKVIVNMPPSAEKSRFRELLRQIRLQGMGLPELRAMINALTDPETKRQMLIALNLVDAALDKFQVESSDLIPLELGIRQIQDQYLQAAIEAVVSASRTLKDAQDKLAGWFDSAMSRASQLYMREMQRFSLVVGFLLALLLNVDTLHMGQTLWEDPALRTAVSITAASAATQLEGDVNQTPPTQSEDANGDIADSVRDVEGTLRQLLDLRLPIGWQVNTPDENAPALATDEARNLWYYWPPNNPNWLGLVLKKLVGLLVTTIAVAQGAPFWFDLLRRLTQGGSSSNSNDSSDKG
ncbi:MAG: hypothetical protein K8L99_17050 [Anaerolineae bacterium]|nr:hypothetical protein [Anaerolineae bacterium]